eukprot:10948908-Ditylum_brightwellii.AAC.1
MSCHKGDVESLTTPVLQGKVMANKGATMPQLVNLASWGFQLSERLAQLSATTKASKGEVKEEQQPEPTTPRQFTRS